MENIKTLKQENNKALKYLHDNFGFDFQKPIVVIKQNGKFTANSIRACLSNEIPDFPADDYEIVMLIRTYSYENKLNDKLHVAVFDEKFSVEYLRGYEYNIDTFYSKGDFEHTRKNKTAYYFVIAQKKEHKCKQKKTGLGIMCRYKYIPNSYDLYSDGKGNTYYSRIRIKELHKNKEPFEYGIRYKSVKTLSEVIDKSGYLTSEYRSELNRRVCAYKNKKRKAEFLATDYSGVVATLEGLFDKLKTDMATAILNVINSSQSRILERALDKFTWGLSYFHSYRSRINEKYYDSKECAENAEKNIRSYLESAFEALREAANEVDGK